MRYRYVLIGYAARPDVETSLPIALACVSPREGECALFLKTDWAKQVSEGHRVYVDDTFKDWLEVVKRAPEDLLTSLLGLSVGPVRTIEDGECDERELVLHLERCFTDGYRRFRAC